MIRIAFGIDRSALGAIRSAFRIIRFGFPVTRFDLGIQGDCRLTTGAAALLRQRFPGYGASESACNPK